MRAWAIILAAGSGSRMAGATGCLAKQFVPWHGAPLYWHSARTCDRCARLAGLVFVFPPELLAVEQSRVQGFIRAESFGLPWTVAPGGALRQDSVRHGLAALRELEQSLYTADSPPVRHVLIHDSARPFASPALFNRIVDTLATGPHPGVIPGLPVTDTIKMVQDEVVSATPNRADLRAVQTPQGFSLPELEAAHARAVHEGWEVTDDAALMERCGHTVCVVAGEARNHKITCPEDLAMLDAPRTFIPCTGFGYDVHRFATPDDPAARPLRLGGVDLHGPGVLAHSDGDVLLHALADALLGCCGAGDIGLLFPDSDPAHANLNSAVIVDEALHRLEQSGLHLTHVDLTVVTQIPKIGPHRTAIRDNVARLLRLGSEAVNVKATTEEGLGFTGAKQGIKAVALVTAVRPVRPGRPASGADEGLYPRPEGCN